MARSRARKLADLSSAGSTFDDGVISASEVTGLGTAATTDSTDYATAGQGTLAASALQSGGGSVTGNVTFGDNNKAIFGAGSDLQVYHDASNSWIKDTGTGNLKISAGNFEAVGAADTNKAFLYGIEGGSLYLYHNGNAKLQTTSTGIDVTGLVSADSFKETVFTVSGTTPALDPGDGTIQFWTLTANSTPTFDASWQNGQSVVFMIQDGTAYTITWPTTNWLGGAAPALEDAGHNIFVIWKAGDAFYGALSGLYA